MIPADHSDGPIYVPLDVLYNQLFSKIVSTDGMLMSFLVKRHVLMCR